MWLVRKLKSRVACFKIRAPFFLPAHPFSLKFLVETPRMRFVLSFIVPLLSSWLISLVTAHNIRVEPRTRGTISPFHAQSATLEKFLTFGFVECFYEDLHKDDKMTVTFLAGPGDEGNIDIDFWVNTRSCCGGMLTGYRLRVRQEFNLSKRIGCRTETFHLMPPRTDSIDTVFQM